MTHHIEKDTEPRPETFELRHSPYTQEGGLEIWRRFGRGAARATGRRRRAALFMALLILVPMVIGLIAELYQMFR